MLSFANSDQFGSNARIAPTAIIDDGLIDLSDKTQWSAFSGRKGYLDADFNRNAQVNNPDKNNYWLPNRTLISQVPQ